MSRRRGHAQIALVEALARIDAPGALERARTEGRLAPLAESGDMPSAIAASISRDAPGFERWASDTFLALARIQAAAGDAAGARGACASALALARRPEEIGRYRWSCGDRDGAHRALADPATAAAAAWSVSRAEAAAGDLTAALEAARALPDPRNRTIALAALAPRLAAQGDVAGASVLARAVDDPSRRTYTLQAVTWARARSRDARAPSPTRAPSPRRWAGRAGCWAWPGRAWAGQPAPARRT